MVIVLYPASRGFVFFSFPIACLLKVLRSRLLDLTFRHVQVSVTPAELSYLKNNKLNYVCCFRGTF